MIDLDFYLCGLCDSFDCAVPECIEGQGRLCVERNLAVALTEEAWYVVPANKKWFRNLTVARTIADTQEAMNLQFPPAEEESIIWGYQISAASLADNASW